MELRTRRMLDRSFTAIGVLAIVLMAVSLVILLQPIVWRGAGAFIFRETVENRKFNLEHFGRGSRARLEIDVTETEASRKPVYDMLAAFEEEMEESGSAFRRQYRSEYSELRDMLCELLGPCPGERKPVLIRDQYGQTRWDRTQVKLHQILFVEEYDYSDPDRMGVKIEKPRSALFESTSLSPLFVYIEENIESMMLPKTIFYWRFLFDDSKDAHFFGGIWPEMLGTFYLAFGAMLFAVPLGIITAVYLAEYAGEGRFVSLLRTCISSLAGVPSIVFGLFGLAFFINTMKLGNGKSVLAGSLTLAFLVLPTVIRASEEAILAVPRIYKEAAMSLGAGKWHTIVSVILPAALPGILTSIIISLGRAAGETAPIIFTAAVSMGRPLAIWQTISQPSPALSWNIYNLATEHEAVDEIRHVQYGMVLTLVSMVLLLNLAAIIIRARVSKKLRG
jgi:phosphate transport system permease protein